MCDDRVHGCQLCSTSAGDTACKRTRASEGQGKEYVNKQQSAKRSGKGGKESPHKAKAFAKRLEKETETNCTCRFDGICNVVETVLELQAHTCHRFQHNPILEAL